MDISDIISLTERIKSISQRQLNEANTKASLIMPFIQAMGYDIFNHEEVAHEYTSDYGIKKGEKVDIAILENGNPIIMIECKKFGDDLNSDKCSQLYRYFTADNDVKIGILTNGQKYLFFSDLDKQNVMDKKPFMEIDLLNFNERLLPELQKLAKGSWDLERALSSAQKLKYTRAVKQIIEQDLRDPSDEIIRHYATQCYDGNVTHKVIDMFRHIVKIAFSEYISDSISNRLNSIKDSENNSISEEYDQQKQFNQQGNSEEITEYKIGSKKSKRFSFDKCGIKYGDIINLIKDPNITAKVIDDRYVEYKGKTSLLSPLTQELLNMDSARGSEYWEFNGRKLKDIMDEYLINNNIIR